MLDTNVLYNEDCLRGMNRLPDKSIDMILCDLPSGATRHAWDSPIPLPDLWAQYHRVIKDNGAIVLFAQTPYDKILGASNIKRLRYEWIWEKTRATGHLNARKMPMKAHENILLFYKRSPTYHPQKTTGHKPINSYTKYVGTQNRSGFYGKTTKEIAGGGETERYPRSVLRFPPDRQRMNLHPTQKPLALCEYMIRTYTNEGEIVLDNCVGSGSTLVACRNTHRQFIGFELDPKYYEIARKRVLSV